MRRSVLAVIIAITLVVALALAASALLEEPSRRSVEPIELRSEPRDDGGRPSPRKAKGGKKQSEPVAPQPETGGGAPQPPPAPPEPAGDDDDDFDDDDDTDD